MKIGWLQHILHGPLSRYLLVGALVNVGLYLLYLIITRFPIIPEVAMTIVFLVGIASTFHFNRRWSFQASTAAIPSFLRYFSVYALAYFLQLGLFFIFYQRMGLPHEIVQAVAICAAAGFIFTCLKLWVFAPTSASGRNSDLAKSPKKIDYKASASSQTAAPTRSKD